MKLEDQVCSLDLAKRLKELGVNQESYFWYMKPDPKYRDKYDLDHTTEITPFLFLGEARAIGLGWCLESYSAFTVAELGEILPAFLKLKDGYSGWLEIRPMPDAEGNGWQVGYTAQPSVIDYRHWEKTDADARAKMLIYLSENNLIKL